jgi:hypothetical protein
MTKREKSPDIANLLGGKAKVEERAPAPEIGTLLAAT